MLTKHTNAGKGMKPIVGYNHKKWNENFDKINWKKTKLNKKYESK